MSTAFTPVSCLCINCRERIIITEPVDRVTCHTCGEVMKVVIGKKLKLPRIPVSSVENKKQKIGILTFKKEGMR
ncbi:hypothetical protein [Methanolobus halotolerans]|uniref:Uncharacterized protein n=1 Tax=Methanolobus halotolerans TaxID=2052935 RepID=A0A4E0Q0L5_9EURY|nr:hypothetical protein [Methanolobus halotolerans]TGC11577.1 hypothetical protein CUN85_01550 [Methanolobus halotolerans]